MARPRIMPILLLSGRRLVKTSRFKAPSYVGDPLNAVKIFNDKEVDEIVILDIEATRRQLTPQFDLIAEISSECFMPITYGGGVSTLDQMDILFRSGVEKIALNTAAFEQSTLVTKAAARFGSQSVVVSIDVRRTFIGQQRVYVRAGQRNTGLDPVSYARRMEQEGAGELLVTSIEREGTACGFDLELISSITSAVSVPVIAHGGASGLHDLRTAIVQGNASAAAAGRMFVFQGPHRAVLITFPKPDEIATILA